MTYLIEAVTRRKPLWLGVILANTVLGSSVLSANPLSVVEQINNCASVTSPASRLQCYDELSESLQSGSEAAGPKQVATPAAPRATDAPKAIEVAAVKPPEPNAKNEKRKKKTLFGDKEDRPPDVKLTLINVERDSRRRWLFTFENGQIWRQLERGHVSIPKGDAVPATLSAGFLGSRNLRLGDNKKFIKVKRVK